jgi:fumarate reductase flavoprotein subunit
MRPDDPVSDPMLAVAPDVVSGPPPRIDLECEVAIVGAGACGLVAGLWARRHGAADVLVLERDIAQGGSTALSSGFVPAAGTRQQQALGIDDSPTRFAADIAAKAHGSSDPVLVEAYSGAIAPVIDTLADQHGLPFEVLDGFLYPGHSAPRMHTLPERTGAALAERLRQAALGAGVDQVDQARVKTLYVDGARRVVAVGIVRPDGQVEHLGCRQLILACNGFGGNPRLVARFLPQMKDSLYFGHPGNQGDAVLWGEALGADLADMGGYQGHGSVATPHGILLTWALMMKGGIQVNREGRRFWNEHLGYSEAAEQVLAQPGGTAWNVHDESIHRFALDFPDYREAEQAGAIRRAEDVAQLAALIGCAAADLQATLDEAAEACTGAIPDRHGRRFESSQLLVPPYRAARVTGALFHTQGGLAVDAACRVLARAAGGRLRPLPNLFAAGGAARGVSGNHPSGYLSGNGLLSALAGGALAGEAAARAALVARGGAAG